VSDYDISGIILINEIVSGAVYSIVMLELTVKGLEIIPGA